MIDLLLCLAIVSNAPSFGEANQLPIQTRAFWAEPLAGIETPQWGRLPDYRVEANLSYLSTHEYVHQKSPITLILVHDSGMSASVWDHPNGGLAPVLWQQGYRVITIDLVERGQAQRIPMVYRDLKSDRDRLFEMLIPFLSERYAESKVILLGHGYGGRRIYRSAMEHISVDALISLNIPLSLGGISLATKRVLEQLEASPRRWSELRSLPFEVTRTSSTLGELLLSRDLSLGAWEFFESRIESSLRLAELVQDSEKESDFPVPVENPLVQLIRERWEKPALLLFASHNGWASPWQCDPHVFRIKKTMFRRHFLTRANGTSLEYNHLDLLMHPKAKSEVFSIILEWLEQFED